MIKKAIFEDSHTIAQLAALLWEHHDITELQQEFAEIIESDEACVFLKYNGEKAVGFAQCQLRHDYVEGTESSPVGYLEGIFVLEEYRYKGYAKELLRECEKWAKEQGCSEFASDCELNNKTSFEFHNALGFTEANRIICFTKKL